MKPGHVNSCAERLNFYHNSKYWPWERTVPCSKLGKHNNTTNCKLKSFLGRQVIDSCIEALLSWRLYDACQYMLLGIFYWLGSLISYSHVVSRFHVVNIALRWNSSFIFCCTPNGLAWTILLQGDGLRIWKELNIEFSEPNKLTDMQDNISIYYNAEYITFVRVVNKLASCEKRSHTKSKSNIFWHLNASMIPSLKQLQCESISWFSPASKSSNN